MEHVYKPKINLRNQDFASRIRKLADKYSIIGVVDVEGLPAPQFQRIRAKLRRTAKVLIVKKNLIELVLDDLENKQPGISRLVEKASGVVGLIFTNDNPFTLFKEVGRNKSTAPAKGGQIAPKDIIVPAGPTGFSPGPIIGELGKFKILAGINAGKVEIKKDSVVAKEGEQISVELAGILSRLGIEPMEVGLNIKSIYEDGTIYDRKTLDVDEKVVLEDLRTEAQRAFQLALGLEYYTKENIALFLGQGARDSLGLGVGIAYPAAETIKQLLLKSYAQLTGVANVLPEDVRPAGLVASVAALSVVTENISAANEGQKEEKKEEPPEVDASAGLGGLF